jgi:hypothetical protein
MINNKFLSLTLIFLILFVNKQVNAGYIECYEYELTYSTNRVRSNCINCAVSILT